MCGPPTKPTIQNQQQPPPPTTPGPASRTMAAPCQLQLLHQCLLQTCHKFQEKVAMDPPEIITTQDGKPKWPGSFSTIGQGTIPGATPSSTNIWETHHSLTKYDQLLARRVERMEPHGPRKPSGCWMPTKPESTPRWTAYVSGSLTILFFPPNDHSKAFDQQ